MSLLGFSGLALSSLRPKAWWRNLVFFFGLSCVAEAYLSFLLFLHVAQTAFMTAYGIIPPYAGTVRLPGSILGVDQKSYPNPLINARFTTQFYTGLGLVLFLSAIMLMRSFKDRLLTLSSYLSGGVRDIYLTPPYQRVWMSTGNSELNPLLIDPETVRDDQLLVSFAKLYQTVQPGGSVSIILPGWASSVANRFQKLMPHTGFESERSDIIYRSPGVPETELCFRKPVDAKSDLSETPLEQPTNPLTVSGSITTEAMEPEQPPVQEPLIDPDWGNIRLTRLERSIIRFAVKILADRQTPVGYRELVNEAYMDLVDKKVDFDSARQIENTLLSRVGKELEIIEEPDETGARPVRKWSLNDARGDVESEAISNRIFWTMKQIARTAKLHGRKILKHEGPKYRPRKRLEED